MSHGLNRRQSVRRLATLLLAACAWGSAWAQSAIVMASTTSTEQSGLFAHLLPAFKQASGIDIKVVALASTPALSTIPAIVKS